MCMLFKKKDNVILYYPKYSRRGFSGVFFVLPESRFLEKLVVVLFLCSSYRLFILISIGVTLVVRYN